MHIERFYLPCAYLSIISFIPGLFASVSSGILSSFVGSRLARVQRCKHGIAKNSEICGFIVKWSICINSTSPASLPPQVKLSKQLYHQFSIILYFCIAPLLHAGKYVRNHLVIAVGKILLIPLPILAPFSLASYLLSFLGVWTAEGHFLDEKCSQFVSFFPLLKSFDYQECEIGFHLHSFPNFK